MEKLSGADEEKAGEPFVGPAGELLNRIIEAMGISRDAVYIGNILNWRPRHDQAFGNRPPTQKEISFACPTLRHRSKLLNQKSWLHWVRSRMGYLDMIQSEDFLIFGANGIKSWKYR